MKPANQEIAEKMIAFAHKNVAKNIKNFCDKNDAYSMRVYYNDAADYMEIADRIQKGELQSAWKLIQNLDTVVRESIPDVIYGYVQEKTKVKIAAR